jgi:hypothetical protein
MVAFDLDGVFVPDIMPKENSLEDMLRARYELAPIFTPTFEFAIITGRPKEDEKLTQAWIDRFFINKPYLLFHENSDFTKPTHYKLRVLEEFKDIHTFVESDIKQCEFLKNNLNRKINVILFSDFINSLMEKLCQDKLI